MKIITVKAKVFGSDSNMELMDFNNADRKKWKQVFDTWKELKMAMRDYKSREPNLPEGLSEVAFCLFSGSKRFISLQGGASSSFDTFNIKTGRAEQIKATSVRPDLTSFGPRSKWDDLYFLDFFSNGKLDGTFDVYKIPSELIYKRPNFIAQQKQGRRPRFSIEIEIISGRGIKPLASSVKVW